jgi:hypothetical protein
LRRKPLPRPALSPSLRRIGTHLVPVRSQSGTFCYVYTRVGATSADQYLARFHRPRMALGCFRLLGHRYSNPRKGWDLGSDSNCGTLQSQRETAGGSAGSDNAAALGAADWVCLAAAPTFAIMALLTGVLGGGPPDMFCSTAQDASPLSGMVPMYTDECLPFGALAKADLQPAKRCPPVLIGRSPNRTVPNLPRPCTLSGVDEQRRLAFQPAPSCGVRFERRALQ